ncbi:MAG: hypothetical protein EBS18_02280 [Actinobacteria bacterium]|nr:hypothetical protein [Actinomycetota bacterium]
MDTKTMIKQWNEMRSQIIQAQLAPTLVLIAILALAALGKFENAMSQLQYLAIGVAAASGILALTTQYAAIREGQALISDLTKAADQSALSKSISSSGQLLSLNLAAVLIISLGTFALVVWAVLG